MYYLKSRYYHPKLMRFINADDFEILKESQDSIIGNNLYCYCLNNPIVMMDAEGTSSTVIIGGKLVIVGCALVLTAAYVVGVAAGKVIIKAAKASSKSKKKIKAKRRLLLLRKALVVKVGEVIRHGKVMLKK